ncbi:hypothetical protein [Sorangium sp. So ce117]|uniref:hypothetical protein n=1 Tax=Sorangium sp. So ce117 TaxID=3133277 RepID=UPI003F63224B
MKTLILSGILEDNGALQLHVPFAADVRPHPSSNATGDDVVEVELLDDNDVVLIKTLVDAKVVCSTPAGPASPSPVQRLISGAVARPDGTAGLRLRWRDRVIHEAHAPAGRPVVRLTWTPPADGVISGAQRVTWDASHPDNVAMHFLVLTESPDGTRDAVASVLARQGELDAASKIELNADHFPPEAVSLVLIASDGFHQTSDKSAPFTVSRSDPGQP